MILRFCKIHSLTLLAGLYRLVHTLNCLFRDIFISLKKTHTHTHILEHCLHSKTMKIISMESNTVRMMSYPVYTHCIYTVYYWQSRSLILLPICQWSHIFCYFATNYDACAASRKPGEENRYRFLGKNDTQKRQMILKFINRGKKGYKSLASDYSSL